MKRRYGKYRFLDYLASWICILLLVIFAILCLSITENNPFISFSAVFLMTYAMIWLLALVMPNLEKFIIIGNTIEAHSILGKRLISLPDEITLVISYADICPPLTARTTYNNTHVLKDKIAVSLMKKESCENTLNKIHRGFIKKYTTSSVMNMTRGCDFIYSFVCDNELFCELVSERSCSIIVPESLLGKIPFDLSHLDTHIDSGY